MLISVNWTRACPDATLRMPEWLRLPEDGHGPRPALVPVVYTDPLTGLQYEGWYCGACADLLHRQVPTRFSLGSLPHRFDESSVLCPETGEPYPRWAGTEPQDPPDPLCTCGALWLDDRCSRD